VFLKVVDICPSEVHSFPLPYTVYVKLYLSSVRSFLFIGGTIVKHRHLILKDSRQGRCAASSLGIFLKPVVQIGSATGYMPYGGLDGRSSKIRRKPWILTVSVKVLSDTCLKCAL